ncbi:MAG: ABC transporter ATP-binding protein [Clostridia bacterium]|nr:ABC transporter ATP-binding protein [Clostridia bacterium]
MSMIVEDKAGESEVLVRIKNLTKIYDGSDKKAVDDLSLEVRSGDVFGFIGRNGAGKSTTIKCLTGQLPFSGGEISVCGHDINERPIEAKRSIGFVSDDHAAYEHMTGRQYVNFIADLFSVGNERDARIEYLVGKFDLGADFDRKISAYSHGTKQKVCIVASLVHEPPVWVLDEPLTGLDVAMTRIVKETMISHAKAGNAVFFSSHNLDAVERICTRAAIISRGKILDIIDLSDFRKNNGGTLEDHFFFLTGEDDETV